MTCLRLFLFFTRLSAVTFGGGMVLLSMAREQLRGREDLPEATLEGIVQLTGAPVPLILEQAKALAADYIVMGSHGHTAFYDLLVGTTTHGVLKKAPCPVLVVPKARAAK